jgi:hypothetical protein
MEPHATLQKYRKLFISFLHLNCSNVEIYSSKVPQVHLAPTLTSKAEFYKSIFEFYISDFGSKVVLMSFWNYIFLI